MKRVTILVPEGAVLSGIEGPHKIFLEANEYCARNGRNKPFLIELAGASREIRLNDGIYAVRPNRLISEITSSDLVIIPPIYGDPAKQVEANWEIVAFIREMRAKGAEIASLCLGAFILAGSGLLDGKQCATHWVAANSFRSMFPKVDLAVEKIVTDNDGIYTSGGAYSHLNLILYLVEKYAGRDVAIHCSKVFAIDIDRGTQSPFIVFNGQKDHGDEAIKQAQEFIESNYKQKISVDQIASLVSMGRRNLERRFKKATANTIVEYIQRAKVEAAKLALESTHDNVDDVMSMVGYTDPKAFRSVFRSITGLTPIDYKTRYNRTDSIDYKTRDNRANSVEDV